MFSSMYRPYLLQCRSRCNIVLAASMHTDRSTYVQPRKVQLRAWNTLPQQDLSLSSERFAEGSHQQRAHDEHILQLITDRFRLRAGHLRHVFRCASRFYLCDWVCLQAARAKI